MHLTEHNTGAVFPVAGGPDISRHDYTFFQLPLLRSAFTAEKTASRWFRSGIYDPGKGPRMRAMALERKDGTWDVVIKQQWETLKDVPDDGHGCTPPLTLLHTSRTLAPRAGSPENADSEEHFFTRISKQEAVAAVTLFHKQGSFTPPPAPATAPEQTEKSPGKRASSGLTP